MRKTIVLVAGILLLSTAFAQNGIKEILRIPWNHENGCKTELRNEGNFGLSAFTIVNEKEIAVVCDVEKKIKIYDLSSGKITQTIDLTYPSKYDKFEYSESLNAFYLLGRNKLIEYKRSGESAEYALNKLVKSIIRIKSFDDNLYLISSKYKSYPVIKTGKNLTVDEQYKGVIDGRMTGLNQWLKLSKISEKTFEIESYDNGVSSNYQFKVNSEFKNNLLAIEDQSENNIFFSFVKLTSVNPIRTENSVLIFSKNNQKVIGEIPLPNIYFTSLLNYKKIYNNCIYHIITSPDAAIFHKICVDTKSEIQNWNLTFPKEFNYKYHFNKDLKKK